MNSKDTEILTGAAMLESVWEVRQSDLLDLITPFVLYTISLKTSPGDIVDISCTAKYVREKYGYPNMPDSVIEKILKRNPQNSFERKGGKYILIKPLDSYITEVERRKRDCEKYIDEISKDLMEYLKSHCTRNKKYSVEEVTLYLQTFFSRYGLLVGTDRLEQQSELTPKDHEIDYYIARYILEKKKDQAVEYSYIISLIKGYYLKTAIYLQPENGNLRSANYSDVEFYYDTPFLIDLLGYQSVEAQCAAKELHNMLKRQKATCYFFPHTEIEITSILTAYQRTIEGKNQSWRTLEGLDQKKYTSAGVERLKKSWPRTLEESYGIKIKSIPEYSKKADGTVNETDILDEKEIRIRIQEQAHHYSQENLDHDMESVLAIHRLRVGFSCTEIESSKAVFVTNNYDLAKAFNRYYRSNVSNKAFSPVITASELSAIAWIKGGSIGDIPEKQLLVNAYMALQPIPELLERFSNVLDQMQTEGKISADAALAMRTSHYVRRELWQTTFGDETATSESTILSIKEKYDQQVLCAHLQIEETEKKKRENELFEKLENQAIDAGRDARKKLLFKLRKISRVICIILVLGSLVTTIISWGNFRLDVVGGSLLIINCLAFYDLWNAREQRIDAFLVRRANQYETKVIEKKKAEYLKLLVDNENTNIS